MSTLSLTNPEAPMKFDWKLPVFLVVIQIIAIAVQWGVISAKLDELFRDKDQQERHLEFIDNELKTRVSEAGEAKAFHDEVIRRFDSTDRQISALGRR
jgi:hypothetical protein